MIPEALRIYIPPTLALKSFVANDDTDWESGLLDSAWPLKGENKFYSAVTFDELDIGSSDPSVSGIDFAGFTLYPIALKTNEMIEIVLSFNRDLRYVPSSNNDLGSQPANSGYGVIPVRKSSETNRFCTYCVTRQGTGRKGILKADQMVVPAHKPDDA